MSMLKRFLLVPVAMIAMVAMSSYAMAQCNSCSGGAGGGFGYPSGGCQGCSAGGGVGGGLIGGAIGNVRSDIDQYKADWAKNHARGQAWPQPFSCWDREHYASIFNQQFANGLQAGHMLTSEYFEGESNELNRMGEERVAWIMQNSTQADKQIFVYEDETGPTMDQRIAAVQAFTNRYYKHLGGVQIAKSQIHPHQIPSAYQQTYQAQYIEGQPAPIIPVQVGATINSTVSN